MRTSSLVWGFMGFLCCGYYLIALIITVLAAAYLTTLSIDFVSLVYASRAAVHFIGY